MSLTLESLYERLKQISVDSPACTYTFERCQRLFPLIQAICQLKKEKSALILAHSYVHPDIIYGVADHCGDSWGLAKEAKKTEAEIILFPSVRFMAETAKLLNPHKIVIDPNPNGGCTLAESIDAETVWALRKQYPEHTFVCYINTTAAVKAACDVCVTSANACGIIERIPSDKIYFLPDRLMGQNIQHHLKEKGVDKEVLFYHGTCYVHEQFDKNQVDYLKVRYPALKVLAHPECHPDVARCADAVCSTTGMIDYARQHTDLDTPLLLLTECGIASRLHVEHPGLKIVGSCSMCRYMRSNSLEEIYRALHAPCSSQIVEIPPDIAEPARRCLDAMFQLSS